LSVFPKTRFPLIFDQIHLLQLTRKHKEIARCTRKLVTSGVFLAKTKSVFTIHPDCELDVGFIIMTFLLIDFRRVEKEGGSQFWEDDLEQDAGEGNEGEDDGDAVENTME